MYKHRFITHHFNHFLSLRLILLVVLFSGCALKSTPPGADIAAGGFDQGGYIFLRWSEGLRVLVLHNQQGSSCHGSGSTTDPTYRLECYAQAADGGRIDLTLHTADGQTAQLWLNKVSYDLAQGTVFLIATNPEGIEAIQLSRDLAGLTVDYDSIIALIERDPDIGQFFESAVR